MVPGRHRASAIRLLIALAVIIMASRTTLAGTTVAVMPFKCSAKPSACELWQEILSAELARGSSILVVEQAQIDKVLAKLTQEQSMAYDSDGAVRLGKLLHADYVLLGSIVQEGVSVVATGRFVNVVDGSLSGTATIEGRADSWTTLASGFIGRLLAPSVSASSFARGQGPDKALDGDTASYWRTATGNFEGWIEVRFPLPVRYSKAGFVSPPTNTGAGVPRNFTLECLEGDRWSEVATGSGNMRLKWSGTFEARECRAWRLRVASVIDRSQELSISELSFE